MNTWTSVDGCNISIIIYHCILPLFIICKHRRQIILGLSQQPLEPAGDSGEISNKLSLTMATKDCVTLAVKSCILIISSRAHRTWDFSGSCQFWSVECTIATLMKIIAYRKTPKPQNPKTPS